MDKEPCIDFSKAPPIFWETINFVSDEFKKETVKISTKLQNSLNTYAYPLQRNGDAISE